MANSTQTEQLPAGFVPDMPAGFVPDSPANSGTKIQDSSTIGPGPAKTNWAGNSPTSDWLSKKLAPIENYTQEGRKEHPILSRIGDVLRDIPISLPTQHPDVPKTPENPEGIIYSGTPLSPGFGGGSALLEEAEEAAVPAMPRPEPAPAPKPQPSPIMSSVRRGPGEIMPERVGAPEPAMRIPAIAQRGGNSALPGGGVIQRPPAGLLSAGGPAEVPRTSLRSLANNVVDRNIAPEPGLKPNVPLREQPDIGRGTPGSRVAMETGPRTVAPGKLPSAITEEPARQMGAPPLQKGVSLREQIKNPGGAVESESARLQRTYPDSGIRQIVHSEGEKLVQAAGGDRALLKSVHDLTNAEVRQAAINSGEDLGQTSVGSRKAVGNQVGRIELIDKMLAKGHTPSEIVRLAKQPTK